MKRKSLSHPKRQRIADFYCVGKCIVQLTKAERDLLLLVIEYNDLVPQRIVNKVARSRPL